MIETTSNLRKAAVLIRSLDADSATGLLAQLSSAEAARIRTAIRALGPIDPDEQADVLAEFRRTSPLARESAQRGVELALSKPAAEDRSRAAAEPLPPGSNKTRFDFLQNAPSGVLVSFLAREHAQTIAVVLSHLAPAHAAGVLAALPEKLQAETIERLSVLGDTDTESIAVLESELAAWVAHRAGGRAERGRRREAVAAILAAADSKTRNAILVKLKAHDSELVPRSAPSRNANENKPAISYRPARQSPTRADRRRVQEQVAESRRLSQPPAPGPQPLPRLEFDHLIHLDDRALAAVLHEVDADALALALAGSGDELVDRICNQMPKRTAKTFRRELRRMGPTRLSDVEAAQRLVAQVAAQQLARRRSGAAVRA